MRPRRPCPPDFREMFIELGWDEIEWHYCTNWRCIRRWVEECGRAELKAARAEWLRKNGRKYLHLTPHNDLRPRKPTDAP